jgi:hypothetical protein
VPDFLSRRAKRALLPLLNMAQTLPAFEGRYGRPVGHPTISIPASAIPRRTLSVTVSGNPAGRGSPALETSKLYAEAETLGLVIVRDAEE